MHEVTEIKLKITSSSNTTIVRLYAVIPASVISRSPKNFVNCAEKYNLLQYMQRISEQ